MIRQGSPLKVLLAVAIALALWAAFADAVRAQPPITLRIDSVSAAQFPDMAVSLTLRDANGVPLTNASPGEFQITEDRASEPRQVLSVQPYVNPDVQIAVILVVDISGSMKGQPLQDAKTAASRFLAGLTPKDSAALIAFNNAISLTFPVPQLDPGREHAFTTDKAAIQDIIQRLEADGTTPLYDAAYKAVLMAAQQPEGNRAVLLFTDGRDEGNTPGSRGSTTANEEDAIQEANRHNIPIFTIGLCNAIDSQWLARVAMRTGGTYQHAPTSADLTRLFQTVADLLKQQYRVTYRSAVPADGAMHLLKVEFKRGTLYAFDIAEWGPAPKQTQPTEATPTRSPSGAAPTVPAPSPTPAQTPGAAAGFLLPAIIAGAAILLGAVAWLAVSGARRKGKQPAGRSGLICPNCGRDVGPDGLCPDCKKPGVPRPSRT